MIILDTQSLIWWIGNPKKLSKEAARAIDKATGSGKLYASSISIWEICMLVKGGRLNLTMDIADWIEKVEALPFLQFIPVDNNIALKSVFLPPPFHKDPADRIIIATALNLGATIVTSDRRILKYSHGRSIW